MKTNQGLPEGAPSPASRQDNPYLGPRSFEKNHLLYGRDVEVQSVTNLIIAERVVLMFAPSGAGKTSLIQAGLLPRLEKDPPGFAVLGPGRVGLDPSKVRKGVNRYVLSTLRSWEQARYGQNGRREEELAQLTLAAYVRDWAKQRPPPQTPTQTQMQRELLIIDQFEELLRVQRHDQKQKEEFIDELAGIVGHRGDSDRRWLLIAMREDFVAALEPYRRQLPTELRTTFRLELLTHKAARDALVKPAAAKKVSFAAQPVNVAEHLLKDLAKEQGGGEKGEEIEGRYIEPVQLQVVCHSLWEKLAPDESEITKKHLENFHVNSALADYYAAQVKRIAERSEDKPDNQELRIRRWIEQNLITKDGFRKQGRRDVDMGEDTLQTLTDSFLIRREPSRGADWYELSHDRLVKPILESNKAWFEVHLAPVQKQAELWGQEPREAFLFYGKELVNARRWFDENRSILKDQATIAKIENFLSKSTDLDLRRSKERLYFRALVGFLLLAILAVLGIWRFYSKEKAALAAAKSATSSADQANQELKKTNLRLYDEVERNKVLRNVAEQQLKTIEDETTKKKQAEKDKSEALQQNKKNMKRAQNKLQDIMNLIKTRLTEVSAPIETPPILNNPTVIPKETQTVIGGIATIKQKVSDYKKALYACNSEQVALRLKLSEETNNRTAAESQRDELRTKLNQHLRDSAKALYELRKLLLEREFLLAQEKRSLEAELSRCTNERSVCQEQMKKRVETPPPAAPPATTDEQPARAETKTDKAADPANQSAKPPTAEGNNGNSPKAGGQTPATANAPSP